MSENLLVAVIGLGGVIVGGSLQWLVSRYVVRSETERLHQQLITEFRNEQFSDWQRQLQSVISDLLIATDPEISQPFQKGKIVPLVLKAQLMLNPLVPTHARLNGLVNELALQVNGWHGQQQDMRTILSLHAALLEAAKKTMYLPGKSGQTEL